jgi:hypothetical protein
MDVQAAALIYLNQRDAISSIADLPQRLVKRRIARGIRIGDDANRLH